MTLQTATLGYPRIGKNREVKKALEAFWSGKSDAEALLKTVQEVELASWKTQLEAGIDRIGIGDTSPLQEVTEAGYSHQIGNGVYDIHSPVVPTTKHLVQQLRAGIRSLPLQQIWVNPDCGLKTRRWEEVIPALKNMVEAAKILREEVNATQN